MIEEINFETYLFISPKKFGIYLFDKKNFRNLYKQEQIYENIKNIINLEQLIKFLEKNIFKIEKLIGKFINNIFILIDYHHISNLTIGVKKKSYQEFINKKFLESIIIEAKDLFNENYNNQKIIHILIKKYMINDKTFLSFKENLRGDHFSIEVEFKYISKGFISEIEKILGNFQINIIKYFDVKYIQEFFNSDISQISEIIAKIQPGFNDNEAELVQKSIKKRGFFEKFFQLFS